MNRSVKMWVLFRQYRRCVMNQYKKVDLTIPARNFTICREVRLCHTSDKGDELNEDKQVDIGCLTKGDETLEKKLKVLILEVDIWRQEGERMPSHLKTEQWKELMTLESRSARKKFLLFCWRKEILKMKEKNKKEEQKSKRIEYLECKDNFTHDQPKYGLGGNTLFMRIRETTMNNFFNAKLIEAMLFSQKLVVDCGYEENMTSREAKNCGKQLMLLFSENRFHINPFNLYFCSAKRGIGSMQEFEKSVRTAYEPHFPLNITEKSYLDLFPKEKLVYLTPHCREELLNYDHDAIYIIGGLVDKSNNEPLSLARSKEQGLKMAKLPFDRYLNWGSGSGKSLTLNQMILILLDMRLTGDWRIALKHVPSRKIQKTYQVDYSAKRFKLIGSSYDQNSKNHYSKLISKNVGKL